MTETIKVLHEDNTTYSIVIDAFDYWDAIMIASSARRLHKAGMRSDLKTIDYIIERLNKKRIKIFEIKEEKN